MDLIQQDQVARANKATDVFNADLSTLKSGGTIAANSWADTNDLRNLNVKMSAGASSANDAAADQLNREALRNGENNGARSATIAGLARDKMRTMSALQSGQAADDYGRISGLSARNFRQRHCSHRRKHCDVWHSNSGARRR